MAIIDDIVSILRGANPDADPQAVQAQAKQMAASPNAASVMARITGAATGLASPVLSGLGDAAVGAGDVVNKALPAVVPPLASAPSAAAPTPPSPAPAAPQAAAPMAPSATPSSLPSKAPSSPATASSPATPTPDLMASSDQATRQAQLAAAQRKANLTSAIGGSIAGLGDTLAGGLRAFGEAPGENAQDKVIANAQEQLKTDKANIETGISNDPNSAASQNARQLVLQIAPQMANQPGFAQMTDQELRDKLPLVDTMMKARAAEDAKKLSMEQLKAQKEISLGEKNSQFEDRQVNQGLGRVAGIRGDASLARTEMQRDAAITAYNRLDQIQKSGQPLNPVDYVDTLGQIYQARTGRAPGEQVLKDIRQYTAEGSLGKAYTAVTGQQAPATSPAIAASLKNMALSMGQQADKMHEAYMAPHLVKPAGVSDAAWAPVLAQGRGMSFAEATKAATPSSTSSDPMGLR